MRKSLAVVWELFKENHLFKIIMFSLIAILGGVLDVYLHNDFSTIVVLVGILGLLGYALLFVLMGFINLVIEVVEDYQVKKDKKKKK